jgi:phosphotransferase system HPr (HPr) family protein
MLKRKLKVKNEYGLHSRPASTLVRLAQKYDSDVLLYRVGEENTIANCKSVIQILSLGANKGTELILSSYDSNAIEEISGFFERSFDEAH